MGDHARDSHPRPTLVREEFWVVEGDDPFEWTHSATPDEVSAIRAGRELSRQLTLPFPPESVASGVAESHLDGTLWYSIEVPGGARESATASGGRLLAHFEAVFGEAQVWVNGQRVAGFNSHYSRATVELDPDSRQLVLEVAIDHRNMSEPRGKQDWLERPHEIWYERSSGIWRDVWFEVVPACFITEVVSTTDLDAATLTVNVGISSAPPAGADLIVEVCHDGILLGRATSGTAMGSVEVKLRDIEDLLWSPDSPTLVDVSVELLGAEGPIDRVLSYAGIRKVSVAEGRFTLNNHPVYVNAVLEQYYWRDSHFTAPSDQARRAEVQLALSLGFNAVRIHQLSPDPRFLYWCDRLGLMAWGEMPSARQFDDAMKLAFLREWQALVRQALPHPSVVTWVPFNESWGVPEVGTDLEQEEFVIAIVHLTKEIDPTRPVISNDGWEHVASDILGYHDYTQEGSGLAALFEDSGWNALDSPNVGPAGRRAIVTAHQSPDAPMMLTEFGGVAYDVTHAEGSWGYGITANSDAFQARVRELVSAVYSAGNLAGCCYTQLTDTLQEVNGLADENRVPKLDVAVLRDIFSSPKEHWPVGG